MKLIIETPERDDDEEAELVAKVLEGAIYGSAPSFRKRGLPRLLKSGIVFEEDPEMGSGIERFPLPWETYEAGKGDCNALITYLGAEWVAYDRLRPTVRCIWLGDSMHVQLRRTPREKPIDPTIICGARVDWPRQLLGV